MATTQQIQEKTFPRLERYLAEERWELLEILAYGLHAYAKCRRHQRENRHALGNAEIILDVFESHADTDTTKVVRAAREAGWDRE